MSKFATITLEMYKIGIIFTCDDIGIQELIPFGDGNKLMDLLNEVNDVCHPDATFQLTEKGKELYKEQYEERDEE